MTPYSKSQPPTPSCQLNNCDQGNRSSLTGLVKQILNLPASYIHSIAARMSFSPFITTRFNYFTLKLRPRQISQLVSHGLHMPASSSANTTSIVPPSTQLHPNLPSLHHHSELNASSRTRSSLSSPLPLRLALIIPLGTSAINCIKCAITSALLLALYVLHGAHTKISLTPLHWTIMLTANQTSTAISPLRACLQLGLPSYLRPAPKLNNLPCHSLNVTSFPPRKSKPSSSTAIKVTLTNSPLPHSPSFDAQGRLPHLASTKSRHTTLSIIYYIHIFVQFYLPTLFHHSFNLHRISLSFGNSTLRAISPSSSNSFL